MLRLEPLPADDAVALVRQAGGGRIADDEAAEIAGRAGGNPFFIVETTGMLLGGDGEHPPGPRTIPATVQAVVAARLDALSPRLRDLARRASVFLYSFDLPELGAVDEAADLDELRDLEEAEILVREVGSGGPARWRVRHATLREVAYASLPKRERLRLHERVADRLLAAGHPSYAADHLELAAFASLDMDPQDRTLPERAADALLGAADRARRRMESRTAVDHYRRTLAMSGPEDGWGVREARALAGMGEARYWLGEYAEARDALERAATIATRARGRVRAGARAAVPRRYRDQRRGRSRQGGGAARPVPRRGRGARRAHGAHPDPAVRRLGAVDARGLRRVGEGVAARPRGRRTTTTGGRACERSRRSRSTARR